MPLLGFTTTTWSARDPNGASATPGQGQQDHKKLGRVRDGGGWRVLGRVRAPHTGHSKVGYDHLEVFVDDASRYAVVVLVADERAESASWAVELAISRFAEVGIRIERMLTDNGASYRSLVYRDTLARHDIRHKRTRPYRPQTNGKAERFIQTLINEWAYARPYRSNGDRLRAPPIRRLLQSRASAHRDRRPRAPGRRQQRPRTSQLAAGSPRRPNGAVRTS